MARQLYVLKPSSFGTILELRCLLVLLVSGQCLDKQRWLRDHVVPCLSGRLLVMAIECHQISGGKMRFDQTLGKGGGMIRYGARHRDKNPGGSPRGNTPFSDDCEDLLGKYFQETKSSGHPTLILSHQGGDLGLRQVMPVAQLSYQTGLFQSIPRSLLTPCQYLN